MQVRATTTTYARTYIHTETRTHTHAHTYIHTSHKNKHLEDGQDCFVKRRVCFIETTYIFEVIFNEIDTQSACIQYLHLSLKSYIFRTKASSFTQKLHLSPKSYIFHPKGTSLTQKLHLSPKTYIFHPKATSFTQHTYPVPASIPPTLAFTPDIPHL